MLAATPGSGIKGRFTRDSSAKNSHAASTVSSSTSAMLRSRHRISSVCGL
jgi:hypothetical protein